MTPKSNQIIVTSVCIHVPSMKTIRQTVLELSSERKWDGRTYVRTDVRTDGQPENIMPPATLRGGGIKIAFWEL